MKDQAVTLPWSNRKRLHFLEFKLFWEGRVNRGDLTDAFGISVPQASTDIARYQELATENMTYNRSAKYYVASDTFHPVFISPSSDAYFAEILSTTQSIDFKTSTFHDYVDVVSNPTRMINVRVLQMIVQAIKYNRKIAIDYRSMKNPEPGKPRWISPHAFASDGFRWHARAYCHKENKFKDYVIGRIANVVDSMDTDIDKNTDLQWYNFVNVIIAPNPALSDDQRSLIAMDYGMTDNKLILSCRIALLWYLQKKLGIDDNSKGKDAIEQQIVLLNKDDIRNAMNVCLQ